MRRLRAVSSVGGEARVTNGDPVISEQIEYYRKRAPEYDDWFYQRGRYDEGVRRHAEWQAEIECARAALRSLGRIDDALELACGTGLWTEHLLKQARRLTAVDASPEVIELALRRVRHDPRVVFEVADLFAYQPVQRYDLVAFAFWLSHVPPERVAAFFDLLRRCLRPGGMVFAVDQAEMANKRTSADRLQERDLADGSTFQVVKVYYGAADVEALFAEHGIPVEVTCTPTLWVAVAR